MLTTLFSRFYLPNLIVDLELDSRVLLPLSCRLDEQSLLQKISIRSLDKIEGVNKLSYERISVEKVGKLLSASKLLTLVPDTSLRTVTKGIIGHRDDGTFVSFKVPNRLRDNLVLFHLTKFGLFKLVFELRSIDSSSMSNFDQKSLELLGHENIIKILSKS